MGYGEELNLTRTALELSRAAEGTENGTRKLNNGLKALEVTTNMRAGLVLAHLDAPEVIVDTTWAGMGTPSAAHGFRPRHGLQDK